MTEPIPFATSAPLTLGVEVEVQLVDWKTKDLCPAAPRMLSITPGQNKNERIKPEIFQSMLELATGVCHDVSEVRRDLAEAQQRVFELAAPVGVEIVGAGTHPFDSYADRIIFPSERYRALIDRNQWIARRLAIFGVHVHVGMRSGDHAIAMMNGLLPYLGHLLAASASSPFLNGHDTGLASSRITVFESQPTAGTPPTFTSWDEFSHFIETLRRARAITSLKDLWWDLRPSPAYGTLEVRIADGAVRLSDAVALTGLVQCLCAELDERIQAGEVVPAPPSWRMRENKWRAARWGLEAALVIDDHGTTRLAREELETLAVRLEPRARALGAGETLRWLERVLAEGPSYVHQRKVFESTRSLKSVVQALAEEWREDLL